MPISLHSAVVPSFVQIIGSARGWLDKAEASSMSEEEVVKACLIKDMLPFAYQVKAIAIHSQGAIEGVRKGVFSPDFSDPPSTLDALREKLKDAETFLQGLSKDEVDDFVGKDMRFEIGEKKLPFKAEDFLLSFSQPNFYFHATTAYGVLRANGVELGKLDYLGALRINKG